MIRLVRDALVGLARRRFAGSVWRTASRDGARHCAGGLLTQSDPQLVLVRHGESEWNVRPISLRTRTPRPRSCEARFDVSSVYRSSTSSRDGRSALPTLAYLFQSHADCLHHLPLPSRHLQSINRRHYRRLPHLTEPRNTSLSTSARTSPSTAVPRLSREPGLSRPRVTLRSTSPTRASFSVRTTRSRSSSRRSEPRASRRSRTRRSTRGCVARFKAAGWGLRADASVLCARKGLRRPHRPQQGRRPQEVRRGTGPHLAQELRRAPARRREPRAHREARPSL